MPTMQDKRIETRIAMSFEKIRDAQINIVKDKLQGITKSKIAGMSDKAILESFGDGWEQTFLNEAAQEIWEGVKWTAQQSIYSSLPMSNLYAWQYNPGAKHCEKCAELHGQIKSLEEWTAEGLPGHRQEGCYANCCCDLVRVEKTKVESIRKESKTGEPLQMNISYAKFLERDFKGVEDEKGNTSKEDLTKEHTEELYIILKHIKKEMGGGDVFGKLERIVATNFNTRLGKDSASSLGIFCYSRTPIKDKEDLQQGLYLNSAYFGPPVTVKQGNRSFVIQAPVQQGYSNSFENTARHEIDHYLLWKHGLKEDPETMDFFLQNRTSILRVFPFIRNKKSYPTNEHKQEEFLVEACSWLQAGKLEEHLKEMNPNKQKQNEEIYNFVKRKFEELKALERRRG